MVYLLSEVIPASAAVVVLAGENGLLAVNRDGAHGAGAQTVINAVGDLGSLRDLGRVQVGCGQLPFEAGDPVVLFVEAVFKEQILDALEACRLGGQEIPDAVGNGRAVSAVFRRDGVTQVVGRKAVVAAALGQLGLDVVHALGACGLGCKAPLQVRDGVSVHLLCQGIETVGHAHLHVAAAATKLGGKSGDTGLDSVQARHDGCLVESSLNRSAVVVGDHDGRSGTDAAAVVVAAPATAEGCNHDDQQDDPPPAVSESVVVAALVTVHGYRVGHGVADAGRAHEHGRGDASAVFVCECH